MDIEFLLQMRQSDICGSVRNDDIFNLHLGSGTCSKTVSLWQYYRDNPASDNNNVRIDFLPDNNNSISFRFKQQITR